MGKVKVKIAGLNLPRLVNRLVEKNIFIDNLKIKKRSIIFSINEEDLTDLDKICKIEHKYYVIVEQNNFKKVFSKIPYLLGSMLAIIITFTYMYSFNEYVFSVNVSYESSQSYDITKVEQLLTEHGIVAGALKKNIISSEIEKLIVSELNDISGCSVKLSGGNLSINIFPSELKYELIKTDLLSKYNAIVTKVEIYNGTTEIKVGDMVKAGEVLIKNDNGASGLIEGKVYFVSTYIYNEIQEYAEKTGRTYKYNNINFCNIFSLKGKNRCGFATFLEEKCDKYISDKYLFPIKIEEVTCFETQIKSKIVPFEEVETNITNGAYEEAYKQVPLNCEVSNVSYSIVKEGHFTRVDCFIETIVSLI